MTQHPRLFETVEEYLRFRRGRCSPTTVKNEEFVLRRFAQWYGDVQLRHMSSAKVSDWFAELLESHVTRDRRRREPIKATTANYYRTRLSSFFRWATRRGWLKHDLLQEVEPLATERPQRLRLSPDDLLRLIDVAVDARDRALIALLTNTAFRRGTATSIKVGDVDLKGKTILVRITKSRTEDLFPITADLHPELERWLRTYAREIGRPLSNADYLFPARQASVYRWVTAPDGVKVRQRTNATWSPDRPLTHPERIIQQALRQIGLATRGEGCHTVRRSVARVFFDSMAEDTGYDAALRTVSALLHHRSSATTEIYLGLTSERIRRDARLRGEPFLTALARPQADVVLIDARQASRSG